MSSSNTDIVNLLIDTRKEFVTKLDNIDERMRNVEKLTVVENARFVTELDEIRNQLKEMKPAVDDWRRTRAIGLGITGMLAIGGVSIGAMMSWFSEQTASLIRHWLKL